MECTGHDSMLSWYGSSLSKGRMPKTYMLVFVLVIELVRGMVPSFLCLAHHCTEEAEETAGRKPAQPAAVACTQLSPNRPADFGLSLPFSLKVIQRKDVSENWFPCTGKRRENLHWKPGRDEHRDEKQVRWVSFQVSCALQTVFHRQNLLISENVFIHKDGWREIL